MKTQLPKALIAALFSVAATASLAQADEPESHVWGWENGAPTKEGSAIIYNIVNSDSSRGTAIGSSTDNIKFTPKDNPSTTAVREDQVGIGAAITADSIWLSSGRFTINNNQGNGTGPANVAAGKAEQYLGSVNAIYAVGGQLFVHKENVNQAGLFTLSSPQVLIGSSSYVEGNAGSTNPNDVALTGASLRLNDSKLSNVTLVEDAKIGILGTATGTITNLDLNGHTLTEGGTGTVIVDGTLNGKGTDGSNGTVSNVKMQLGNGVQVSNVTFDGSDKGVTLANNVQVTMSDVAFTNGASVTVSNGSTLTLVDSNGSLTLGAGSSVSSTGITGDATGGTLTLTETSVASVGSVVDNAVTVDYTGLSVNFANNATVNLELAQGFILALQKEVMPDAARILTINFGDAVDISNAILGTVNIGGGFPTLAEDAYINGNTVVLTFKQTNAIPEPATVALSLLALAGLAARRRRK